MNNQDNPNKAIIQSREEFEEKRNRSKPSLSDLMAGEVEEKGGKTLGELDSLKAPEYKDENEVSIIDNEEYKEPSHPSHVTKDMIKPYPIDKEIIPTVKEADTEENDEIEAQLDEEDILEVEKYSPTHIDNLIKEIEDMDKDPITTNTILEDITKLVKEELGTSKMNKIDINKFVVANEPINLLQIMEKTTVGVNTADWVLMDTGRRISMKEFSGMEIEMLNPANSRRNQYNTVMDIFANIHDHILNNPISTDVKTFLKSVNYTDIDSLYYAAYRASFNDSNKITYICPNDKCNHVFLKDIDMDDMYKFTDDEAEERFWNIYETGGEELITSTVVREQVSNDFVVDIISPSIYSIMVESTLLNEAFVSKYHEIIGILTFIKQVYKIDHSKGILIPIQLKEYDGDESKTLRYKILNYAQILRSLTSYEHARLMKLIEEVGIGTSGITYIIPESKCEKCGYNIEEKETTTDDLIFTRHRLDILANS